MVESVGLHRGRISRAIAAVVVVSAAAALLVSGSPTATAQSAANNKFAIAREPNANYGVKTRFTVSPFGSITCAPYPSSGFAYLAIWQTADRPQPLSWVEAGVTQCDPGYITPQMLWVQVEHFGIPGQERYIEEQVGYASPGSVHNFKIFSHFDGRWQVYVDGVKVGTALNYNDTPETYQYNHANVGLELSWQGGQATILQPVSHRKLTVWRTRTDKIPWNNPACHIDPPTGGKWVASDKWRVFANTSHGSSNCTLP